MKDLQYRPDDRVALVDGRPIALTEREGELFQHLLVHRGEVVARTVVERQVWGMHPGARSDAVPTTVRRLRTKIGEERIETIRGIGWRLLGPEPTLQPQPPRPESPRTSFVGRGDELDELRAWWQGDGRVVAVVGPGGVGKSRLVQEWLRRAFLQAVWVELSGAVTAEDVGARLVAALGLQVGGGDTESVIERALRGAGPTLLVLDDPGRSLSPTCRLCDDLLAAAPLLRVVVTSRERPPAVRSDLLSVGPLPLSHALRLFEARARSVTPGYAVPEAVGHALVEQLDRLPLAIELAAARSLVLSPSEMLARLDDRFRLLSARSGAAGQTLRECIAWSWELLGPAEARALEQVSVFAGSFTMTDAEAVLGEEAEGWSVDTIQSLVEKSLIQRGEDGRLSLLHAVRDDGRARLGAQGRWEQALGARASSLARFGDDDFVRRQLLYADRSDLEELEANAADLRALVSEPLLSESMRRPLVRAYWLLLRRTGPFAAGWEVLRNGLDDAEATPLESALCLEAARLCGDLSWLRRACERPAPTRASVALAEWGRAMRKLGRHEPIARELSGRALQGEAEADLRVMAGVSLALRGQYRDAVLALRRGLAMHQAAGNARGEAEAMVELACFEHPRDWQLARAAHARIVEHRWLFLEARCLRVYASVFRSGAPDATLPSTCRSRMLDLGSPTDAGLFTMDVGIALAMRSDASGALCQLALAVEMLRPVGGLQLASARMSLAHTHAEWGDLQEATRLAEQALADVEAEHAAETTALHRYSMRGHLALVYRHRGELAAARATLAELPPLPPRLHPAHGRVLLERVHLALERGDRDEAGKGLEQLSDREDWEVLHLRARHAWDGGQDGQVWMLRAWEHPQRLREGRSEQAMLHLASAHDLVLRPEGPAQ